MFNLVFSEFGFGIGQACNTEEAYVSFTAMWWSYHTEHLNKSGFMSDNVMMKQTCRYKSCVSNTWTSKCRANSHMENVRRFYFSPTALFCGVQVKVSLRTDPSFKESSLCILNRKILKDVKNKIHRMASSIMSNKKHPHLITRQYMRRKYSWELTVITMSFQPLLELSLLFPRQ
jgi:hypothetical protein